MINDKDSGSDPDNDSDNDSDITRIGHPREAREVTRDRELKMGGKKGGKKGGGRNVIEYFC